MRVLAGDVGGTKTSIGLFECDDDFLSLVDVGSYASDEYAGLIDIVTDFVGSSATKFQCACFGIAGPVVGRRVRVTNLPWVVDADEIERSAGVNPVVLINDLEATAWGVREVADEDLYVLNTGRSDATGNGAVIAAGTGLGEAGLFWNGRGFEPFACEGGHASFSPTETVGDGLLEFLRTRFDPVSWERVLSGPGLADLYRHLLEVDGGGVPEWFAAADREGDPVPAISKAAIDGRCEISVQTLKHFCRLYGEEAGNLALKLMATGGVWIGGGIAPKILQVLSDGSFLEGFLNKGRMRTLMEAIPVRVILDDRAALLGAARCAASISHI